MVRPGRPKMSPMKRMFKEAGLDKAGFRSQVTGLRNGRTGAGADRTFYGITRKRRSFAEHWVGQLLHLRGLQEVVIARWVQRDILHSP